jgi:hypothetical protein
MFNPPVHIVSDPKDEAADDVERKSPVAIFRSQVLPQVRLDLGAARVAD